MILAAGLTPAWQQVLVFDRLHLGEVNRARTVLTCASGKVLNVGFALHQLGAPSLTVTMVGGRTGELIRTDFAAMPARWVEVRSATRVCTTLLELNSSRTTELVENAGPVTPEELDRFLHLLGELQSEYLVLSGSLPPGAPANTYRRVLENFRGAALLDARGPELLEALSCRPLLIKPNRHELSHTMGHALDDESDLFAAMHELNRRGAEWVLVTDGAGPIRLTHAGQQQTLTPVPVPDVVNPIGSGDCLTAGVADPLQRGRPMLEAIRWGMACAADNAGQLLPARIDRQRLHS